MPITRKVVFAFLAGLLWAAPLAAQIQTGSISGRVEDATSQVSLAGASVTIEGTRRGTTVGTDGAFSLTGVPVGIHRVTVRLVGYAPVTQEVLVRVGLTATAAFSLERQVLVLDEIVVTGYGAQRRAEITGSIATVNADEAKVGVVTNVDEMIQGRVAGVNITRNGGEPGAGVQIRIRGGTSLSGGNEPLYVVDGIPIQNLPTEARGIGIGGNPSLPRNPLNLINPNDIESITVLKDATAGAIYGARGANGVILIETKQGQRDRTTFEYDAYVSISNRAESLDLLSAAQYRQFIEQEVAAGNLAPARLGTLGSDNTDWQDRVTRTALTTNHDLAFSGGTASTQYRASLNYMNQEGVAISSGLQRFQGRLNGTQYALNDRLQLRINLTSSHVRNDYTPFQNGGGFEGDLFQNMVVFNPTRPVMVTDPATGKEEFFEIGTGVQSTRNPVALANQIQDFASTTRTLGNVRAQLDIFSNLRGQLTVGVDRTESTRRTFLPGASPVGAEFNGRALQEKRELEALTLQGLLTLTENLGDDHKIEVTGGYEFNDFSQDNFASEARDFLTDAFSFNNLAAGAQLVSPSSFRTDNRLVGFFSRVNYGFKDRYFLTGVIRHDGSSRFGENNRWATFPAVSAAWRISEESFMRDGLFSELRLRGGFGTQGNEAVPAFASLLLLQPSDGASFPFGDRKVVGVAPASNPNPDLKWEKTSQFNVGIDYGLLDNRISGSFEYYVKTTSDLLLTVTVPQPAVVPTRLENVGKVRNRGLEATLDALLINRSNMTWDAGLVFAAEASQVRSLGKQTFITTGSVSGQGQSGQVSQRLIPGFSVGTFFGPEFVGVDANGEQLFNDYENGVVVGEVTGSNLQDNDKVPIGNANPDFTLGLRSQFKLGRFDASVLFRAKSGQDVFNNTALVYGTKGNALQDKNFLASALDDPTGITQPAIFSSRWIEGASYLRLENLTLGYTIDVPAIIATGRTARFYVSADNLFLITGYSGYDPEVHTVRDTGEIATRGIDYLSYPRARTFTTGVRFAF